ncbi:ribosome maturation factor RimP [Leuconostocaceae bacterium ESL0723]|nr:ribosome maturation factor RimP [Leuconostocaceae bacterium ESL0723]
MSRQTDTVRALIQPIIDQEGLLLWDLTLGNSGGQKVLTILVDRPNHEPITMDMITTFTQAVNQVLDEADPDPIPGAYLLDISSPGADRPLKERWHYEWAKEAGEPIQLALFAPQDGQKKWQGELDQVDDTGLVLKVDDQSHPFTYDQIAKAVLDVQF